MMGDGMRDTTDAEKHKINYIYTKTILKQRQDAARYIQIQTIAHPKRLKIPHIKQDTRYWRYIQIQDTVNGTDTTRYKLSQI